MVTVTPPTHADLAILRAQRSLLAYAQYVSPDTYLWGRHHELLCAGVDRLIDPGDPLRFLLIEMPPRHGKSEVVSRLLPAYYAGRYPHREIIAASYGATLAQDMNQDVQAVMDRAEHLEVFPGAALPTGKIRTGVTRTRNREAWQLADPDARGGYKCVGVGGGLTGKGAHLAVIDDPVKDWKDARSQTTRDSTWHWYKSVLRTRLAPAVGCVLLTMTRWHEDDLAGRVMAEMDDGGEDQWERIRLPAVCEDAAAPNEWREVGDPLWPERFPIAELSPHQADVGVWSALYQQRPLATESAMFKTEHWEVVEAAPVEAARVRYWDMAATKGGDYTVGLLMARDRDGLYYVADVVRGQWTPGEVERAIANTASLDGKGCTVAWEEEKGASGKYVSASLQRLLAGYNTKPLPVSGSKEVRAQPYSAQQAAGNVKLVRAPWNSAFVAEHASFPLGRYDDQVDAGSGAMECLAASVTSTGKLRSRAWRLPTRDV